MRRRFFQVLVFLYCPKLVIRELVGKKPWKVVIVFSLMFGMWFGLVDAEVRSDSIVDLPKPLSSLLVFVITSLLVTIALYQNGRLRRKAGRPLGGAASAWELSAASAWSTIASLPYFTLVFAIAPHFAAYQRLLKNHVGVDYFLLAITVVCLVWGLILDRASVIELQGFTKEQARAAGWNRAIIQFRAGFFILRIAFILVSAIVLATRVRLLK